MLFSFLSFFLKKKCKTKILTLNKGSHPHQRFAAPRTVGGEPRAAVCCRVTCNAPVPHGDERCKDHPGGPRPQTPLRPQPSLRAAAGEQERGAPFVFNNSSDDFSLRL